MTNAQTNPLLQDWQTPYGIAPFKAITAEHFAPAFSVALATQRAEIDVIAQSSEAASFDNTVAAFDASGRLFSRIDMLFGNLTSSETSPALQAVEREMAPQLAAHSSWIFMHAGLFARVDALYAARAGLGVTPEQLRLLERVHLDFVRAGAKLAPDAQARYAAIMQELAQLQTQFTQNVLADEAAYQLVLKTPADTAGLPDFVLQAANNAAAERNVDGSVVTLSRSLIVPFLSFSKRRDLREQAFKAWTQRGENTGAHDNRPVAQRILQLRLEQAQLHGYASFADYSLVDSMAGQQSAVKKLLAAVWEPAKAKAAEESAALLAAALAQGDTDVTAIEPWDWRYYAEKVRKARYDLDEAELKPYFSLERMMAAMFDCAGRLFGVSFTEKQVTTYHPDVRMFEVRDAKGSVDNLVGVFLSDNFARASKRGGAWMSAYRSQSGANQGVNKTLPIIVNNNNFAKASPGQPTLLSFDDARTLFHEFGHGLHGLLSNVTYERLGGTNVLRDFVELPSQLFEHWLSEPAVLKQHALHYQTNAPIPDALLARLQAARRFNQGFETVEFASSAPVDMALHGQTDAAAFDISEFERAELKRLGMPREIVMRHRLPHFGHLFSGSWYAAGYYVYLWAEVLDADGYNGFKEAGDPFDAALAARLKQYIYSSGNTIEPGAAYRAFRGRDAAVEPMLAKRGLLEQETAA